MAESRRRKNDGRSVVLIILVLSALRVFSISFSAPCFGNQKQSTSLPDDSCNYCSNPEPIAQILVYQLCMLSQAQILVYHIAQILVYQLCMLSQATTLIFSWLT